MLKSTETILTNWNQYFNYNCKEEFSGISFDEIFNSYLYFNNKDTKYEYISKVCFVEKQQAGIYTLTYYNGSEIIIDQMNTKARRKFYNLLGDFEVIITKNFPLITDNLDKHKTILRHEIVKNILTSNETHFFSKDLPFSINDNRVFLTSMFYSLLFENVDKLNILKFGSFLLNQFEVGMTIDDIKLKPKISVSNYGRWYWSGTEKVQNDKKSRQKIYNKFIKYGKILNIDLISGEPTILANLSESKVLKKLLKYRLAIKDKNYELSDALKFLINMFIHSSYDIESVAQQFKTHNILADQLEESLGVPVVDLLLCLQDEFLCYNRYVLDEHRKNFSVKELNRRIVIPHSHELSDIELIKEHRKYLQGHTHDRILNLAQRNYLTTGLIPIFTVHDSISYFINNHDATQITDQILKNSKDMKYPITFEILEELDA